MYESVFRYFCHVLQLAIYLSGKENVDMNPTKLSAATILSLFAVTTVSAANPYEDYHRFVPAEGRENPELVAKCVDKLGYTAKELEKGSVFQYRLRRCISDLKRETERQQYIEDQKRRQSTRRQQMNKKAKELKEKHAKRYKRTTRIKYRQKLERAAKSTRRVSVRNMLRKVRSDRRVRLREIEEAQSQSLLQRRSGRASIRKACANTEGKEKLDCIRQQIHNLNLMDK